LDDLADELFPGEVETENIRNEMIPAYNE